MDSDVVPSSRDLLKCCNCGCRCSMLTQSSGTWMRSVKRKLDEFKLESQLPVPAIARVDMENECVVLREMVTVQQKSIQDLNSELDEERNSSSTAANEAMSMILRLQREKAEIQMEARQFKRFAEEKMTHDQEELLSLEDLLYKREQIIQSLTCEVQAYKHRMMSFGFSEAEVEGDECDLPPYEYPPLKCNVMYNAVDADNDDTDVEKYVFGETPTDRLRNLENRISQMERSPTYSQMDGTGKNVLEKVIVGQSPRRTRHSRKVSCDSTSFGGMGRETGPDCLMDSPKLDTNSRKEYFSQSEDHSNLKKADNGSEGDDTSDRIYTIDSVHTRAPYNGFTDSKVGAGAFDDCATTPMESGNLADFEDPYVKKLYMRLQALEADRESMRQAIISMRTDKAQLVLLKEIAQHLCKDMSPQRKIITRKPYTAGKPSFLSIFKWVASFVFWRKKAQQSKYMFGLPADSVGLLLLLDKETRTRPWRCISNTQLGD